MIIFALSSPVNQAYAEIELGLFPNTFDKFSVDGQLHLFLRHDTNPSFGAAVDSRGRSETTFGETVAKLGVTFEKKLAWTDLEGRISGVLMTTINADVYGVADDESQGDLNEGFLNFKNIYQSPFDIKVGRQNIFIEKSFISGDANPEDAAIWISAHKSFPLAVRADGDFGKLKTTAFWADTELYSQQGDQRELGKRGKEGVSFTGINLHYDISETAYLYGGYYRKIDESNITFSSFSPGGKDLFSENNTNALDIGFDASVKAFHFAGEFVYQLGDAGRLGGQELSRDAYAGFAQARYNFNHSAKPYLKLMYINFSGDSNLEDDKAEDYDPMFITSNIWNEWLIGQLVGEVQLSNSNKIAYIADAGFSPLPGMQMSFMFIKHYLAEQNLGVSRGRRALSNDDYANEWNFLVDYEVNKNMNAHFGAGYVIPGDAAKEFFGNNNDTFFSQMWLKFHF
ncbi:MAG: alginate export family protein [Nitrospina sp.]|nr:alginate export family protein [Nitrospina sp.]MBT3508681.1 alginate export family protein [Nitrospina sp.]MBT3874976.1 alginate export family protein [Nitrospina sp.]MBT4048041.1 alginate export family protein [Nitrospina sp.]MBT4556377.1 alginate export family protein [Nitrospina sp.]